MDPDAVHNAEAEHDHEHEGTGVADERQRNAGDRQQRNRHPDVLEDVGEDERRDSDHKKQPKLITGKKGDEDARQ